MNPTAKPFERRKTDRRSRSRAVRADESWFGAFLRDAEESPEVDDLADVADDFLE